MGFGVTPVDGSATPIPMSSVVPDGTSTPTALEGGPSLSSGGNTLAPASMYVKDGNNVTQGAKADSAATDSTSSWSAIALLKGVYAKLAGTLAANLTQINGAAISNTNAFISEPNLQQWARAGNMFTASTDRQLASGAGTIGLTLFCNNIAKSVMIVSVRVSLNNNILAGDFSKLTAANTLGNALTPVNHNFNSGTTSLANVTYGTSSVTPSGVNIGTFASPDPGQVEVLANVPGRVLYIPANSTLGFGIWPVLGGAGYFGIDITWVEF